MVGMPGIDIIRAERIRQTHSLGYKPENDVGRSHTLERYAITRIESASNGEDTRRNLIEAGALIAAALDAFEAEVRIAETDG